jgi:hypothetical protein
MKTPKADVLLVKETLLLEISHGDSFLPSLVVVEQEMM